jgi:hypothetical protein
MVMLSDIAPGDGIDPGPCRRFEVWAVAIANASVTIRVGFIVREETIPITPARRFRMLLIPTRRASEGNGTASAPRWEALPSLARRVSM